MVHTFAIPTGRTLILGAAVSMVAGAGCGDPCAAGPAVAPVEGWRLVEPTEDPWGAPPTDTLPCAGDEVGTELLDGTSTFTVVTAQCGWMTATQPAAVAVEAGQVVRVRLFWFSQTLFPAGAARVGLRLGDETLVEQEVPIPSSGSLLERDVRLTTPHATGEPAWFHIGNHGQNSWNLFEVQALPAQCGAP